MTCDNILNKIPDPPFCVINPRNGRIIARVDGESVKIYDGRRLQLIKLNKGISIPPFLQESFFNGKSNVPHPEGELCDSIKTKYWKWDRSESELFYKAFLTAECWHLLRAGYAIEEHPPLL